MKIESYDGAKPLTLNRLGIGQRGRVASVAGKNSTLRARLLAMGLVAGTAIEVVCVTPFGDAIQIKTRGYDLSLRNSEATYIQVELA